MKIVCVIIVLVQLIYFLDKGSINILVDHNFVDFYSYL